MKRDYSILTTIWFLAGLLVLLLNDLVLKEAFANWFTGKLSDFAGLFIFPLFWTVLLPKHKNKIFWLTALCFTFWKSSYSQVLIDSWNNLGLFGISRVVDYTDLMALSILPFAYFINEKKEEIRIIKVQPVFPIIVASFSFMATSYDTNVDVEKEYMFPFSKDTLERRIFYLPGINNPIRQQVKSVSSNRMLSQNNLDSNQQDKNNLDLFVKDTMEIFIYEDFCFEGYTADIILFGNDESSGLKLTNFHHVCPKDGAQLFIKSRDDLKILTESFEKNVIHELNK